MKQVIEGANALESQRTVRAESKSSELHETIARVGNEVNWKYI